MYVNLKMRHLVVTLFLALLIVISPSFTLFTKSSGFYQPIFNIAYCETNENTCRHEIGHVMDYDMGGISKSQSFGAAISVYMYFQYKYDDMNIYTEEITRVLYYSDTYYGFGLETYSSPQEELYARLYADAKGDIRNIPELLRPYYSDDPKYQKMYEQLLKSQLIYTGETQ